MATEFELFFKTVVSKNSLTSTRDLTQENRLLHSCIIVIIDIYLYIIL